MLPVVPRGLEGNQDETTTCRSLDIMLLDRLPSSRTNHRAPAEFPRAVIPVFHADLCDWMTVGGIRKHSVIPVPVPVVLHDWPALIEI